MAIPAVHRVLAPARHQIKRNKSCSVLAPLHFVMVPCLKTCCCSLSAAPPHPTNPPQLWLSSRWTNFVIGPQTAAGEQPRPTKATWECNMWSCVTRDQGSEPLRGAKIKPQSINVRETKKGKQTPIWWYLFVLICLDTHRTPLSYESVSNFHFRV